MEDFLREFRDEILDGFKKGTHKFWKDEYALGSTYLEIVDVSKKESIGAVSVFITPFGNEKYICVDTNNFSIAPSILKKLKVAKDTGETRSSGYCVYPVYELDLDKLEKYLVKEAA